MLRIALLFFILGAGHEAVAQLTILHSFGDGSVPNDGADPRGGLMQTPDGNFYGATRLQVNALSGGTIFRMTPTGTVSILESGITLVDPPFYANGILVGTYFGKRLSRYGVLFGLTGYPDGPWSLTK